MLAALGLLTVGELRVFERPLFSEPAGRLALVARLRGLRLRANPDHLQFETATPLVENNLRVAHDLRRLLVTNSSHDRQFIGAAFFVVVLSLGASILRGRYVRASLWSLAFLATVFAFGHVNDTRHYLALLAFWVVHPFARRNETACQSSLPV